MINTSQPDIIKGTETWLEPKTSWMRTHSSIKHIFELLISNTHTFYIYTYHQPQPDNDTF